MQNQINKTNKIANSTKNAETTIIIANSAYLINPVPVYHVKAGGRLVQYKPIGKFTTEERTLLSQSLKASCIYINEVYSLLKEAKTDTLEKVESILGELEESTFENLLANIQQIQDKILSTKLVVLKENYLDTENDHILASVKEDDTFTFTVYNNFFDEKEFKDNRAGVIIHELCHLCDIEEGADMYDVDSAECLKNIILHLNDILSLNTIQAEYAKKQEPQERDDDILTYDENQPRVPAGSPEGGQWTSGGGSGGSGGSGSSSGSNPRESISQYSDSLSSNFKINALSGDGYSYLKPETVGSINVGAVDAMHQIESDYNNRIFQEEAFKSIADGSTPLLASNGNIAAISPSFTQNPNVDCKDKSNYIEGEHNKPQKNIDTTPKQINLNIRDELKALVKSENPVSLSEIYKTLDFDPNGRSEETVGTMYALSKDGVLNTILGTTRAYLSANIFKSLNRKNDTNKFQEKITPEYTSKSESLSGAAREAIPSIKEIDRLDREARTILDEVFPTEKVKHNNYADAFRHAYFNYRLTELIGARDAKKFADAHEITDVNDNGERLMDLVNNKTGRDLYLLNKTKGKEDAKKVLIEAYKNGLLRERVFSTK